MEVSVRELKSRLSEFLRRVQAGEEVSVTVRGRVVARLTGAGTGSPDPVARLREAPGVTWPDRGRAQPPRRVRPGRGAGLADAVREERDEAP